MTSINLSPPRNCAPQRQAPSPNTRSMRRATVSHNTSMRDRLSSTVTDFAFHAAWELQTAITHPSHAVRRLSDAVRASTSAAPSQVSGFCEAIAHEGSEIGVKLMEGCEKIATTAKRAARKASISLSGKQQIDGVGGWDSDESFQEVFLQDCDENDNEIFPWPDCDENKGNNENLR
ncbi:hypothetical protein TWF694_011254 [Orbilia ellipsospora]|uniref:Uncharacterized protein n=1 Tax=Orbilia ellipsospora TaxID=2528407 RepID=A0AAV9X8G7_9PEZI